MTRLALTFAAAALLACASQANAGETYFTAYDGTKQADVRDTKTKKSVAGKQIRVYAQADYDKLADSKKKDNAETATMCGVKYFLSKKDLDWMKAHEGAKHEIRVREHGAKGKYAVVCPKDAATPQPPAKKGT